MVSAIHIPVLVEEVLAVFSPQSGDCLLDATVGHGGHAAAYLEATSPSGTVVGLDTDPKALAVAKQNLKEFGNRVRFVAGNFSKLTRSISSGSMFFHILFDLGLGSHQLSDAERGFSFAAEGSLTMAYGQLGDLPPAKIPALNALERHLGYLPDVPDLLGSLSAADLAHVIRLYSEERHAEAVARAVKKHLPLETPKALAQVIAEAVPSGYERGRIHPATRTFQALRLAVNRELEALEAALPQAVPLLQPQGVIAVISFHSLEDRLVKQFFRSHKNQLEILTKKPVRAGEEEVRANPRSRSAKLRAARKT